MNKAFVREPEWDGRAYCVKCGSLGRPVGTAALDQHIRETARKRLGESAWFCDSNSCEVAYFDLYERYVAVDELRSPVYPKDLDAPICACFGFTADDVDADVQEGTPRRIRELLAKSQSPEARCHMLAADGHCCMREVQKLYIRWTAN